MKNSVFRKKVLAVGIIVLFVGAVIPLTPASAMKTLGAPFKPIDPLPENNSVDISINPAISVFVTDPDSDTMNVSFYASDHSFIDSVEDVQNGTRAEVNWSDLQYNTTYSWYAVADDGEYTNQSDIWNFTTAENKPPYPPIIISGPSFGGPGIELYFSAVTSDHEGDKIYYMFDWGDGNYSDWLGPYDISIPVITNHSWNESREYKIRTKAKDTYSNAESDWSEPHNISISKQIEINNLKPGFIYFHIFTFDKSYLYIYMFETWGVTGMISTEDSLSVNATVTESVDLVKFEANQLLMNMTSEETDDNMSDGANTLFLLNTGLFEITAYAYDEEGNMIDNDKIDYLVFFSPSTSDSGMIRRVLHRPLLNMVLGLALLRLIKK